MSAIPSPFADTPVRAPVDWISPLELTTLGAIWGASFLFMRVAAPEFGPLPLVSVRLAFGALVLLPFVIVARRAFTRATWLRLAVIGAVNSAIPFTLFAWAATRAPAAIGALTNGLTVMFTALIAFAVFGERIGARRAIGLAAGFLGVLVLTTGKTAGASVTEAALAGTLAALFYGVAANMVRRYVADLPAVAVAGATLLWSAILVAPIAIAQWPTTAISTPAWTSALLLGVLCTGIAYALYFRLLKRIGAPRAVTVTYLVPLFGVAWAWLVLGEPLTWPMALAGALIFGGVALSQAKAKTAAKPVRAPDATPCNCG